MTKPRDRLECGRSMFCWTVCPRSVLQAAVLHVHEVSCGLLAHACLLHVIMVAVGFDWANQQFSIVEL